MEDKAGAQISIRAFLQSVIILLVLMVLAGVLTRVIPAGNYARVEQGGRTVIDPTSYQQVAHPNYPVWRWFTAPLEVLAGPDALIIITIIVFILLVGGAFAILDKSGILAGTLNKIVTRFGSRKYLLLLTITLFFMALGAFFGLFEEIVPLVPLMIALAYSLGWDALVGLGMSILATNMGFSAAMTNPFSIGVAQKLAGLPLFSGISFRIPFFILTYGLMAWFLVSYARRIERKPESSLIFGEDQSVRAKYSGKALIVPQGEHLQIGRASLVFGIFVALIIVVLFSSPFVPAISDYSLPIVGLLFFLGGLVAGLISGTPRRKVFSALWQGITGIAPGIPLILMAASVKYIVAAGGVMDTILHQASLVLQNTSPVAEVFIMYGLALFMEIFISSAGAKAVLMMPILLPLADIAGVTRQATVTAYCFGDGFSNLAYPTNPVLLICLGLAAISYGIWLKWTWKLWAVIVPLSLLFLAIAVWIKLGPF